jgi:hypothetical protein
VSQKEVCLFLRSLEYVVVEQLEAELYVGRRLQSELAAFLGAMPEELGTAYLSRYESRLEMTSPLRALSLSQCSVFFLQLYAKYLMDSILTVEYVGFGSETH